MLIRKLSHVAIAVRDLEQQVAFYRDVLGLRLVSRERALDQGVEAVMFAAGETHIELLAPLGPDTPVGRFLDKRGPGLHHVAYEVDDVAAALAELRARGVALVDEQPRTGAGGTRIAFLHPRTTGSVLTELCELGHALP